MVAGTLGVFAVGLALGFLGAGGASIALPVLVYLVGLDVHGAVALSILLVGGSSVFGALLNARQGYVRWNTALAFAPSGIAGAVLGSAWSYRFSGRALLLCFSALLLVTASRMMMGESEAAVPAARRKWHWFVLAGFAIGLLIGLLGVGGGFVLVPAMVYVAGLSMREAVGTSLLVSAINSAAAFAGHASQQRMPWRAAALLLVCAAVGMAAGVGLSHRTEPARLRRYFAGLLLVLAGYMLWRNW